MEKIALRFGGRNFKLYFVLHQKPQLFLLKLCNNLLIHIRWYNTAYVKRRFSWTRINWKVVNLVVKNQTLHFPCVYLPLKIYLENCNNWLLDYFQVLKIKPQLPSSSKSKWNLFGDQPNIVISITVSIS